MTNGLEVGDVYSATIKRINAQDGCKSRLGVRALMWVSNAERPPRANEVCHPITVELCSTDFDFGNIPSISTLVTCCQGLIVDKEVSTVGLIHFTLQEHLSSHPDIFGGPHSAIATTCLTYLNTQQVKDLLTAPSADAWNAPFLEYLSVYSEVHAKRELSDCGRSLELELFKGNYGQISTRLLLEQEKYLSFLSIMTFSTFSRLHCLSFFGIVEVVVSLTQVEKDVRYTCACTLLDQNKFIGREGIESLLVPRE